MREAFDEILRFWFDRGIAGWRIDVTHGIVKDRELRDDPVGDRGRPPADPGAREQAGVLDEPPRGPRRAAALARDRRRRRPAAHPRGGDLRARPRAADAVLRRGRGRAQPRLQLPVRARAARGRGAAGDRRRGRAGAAGGVVAGLGRLQPRRGPARHALGGGRPGARPARGDDAADAARHTVPLLRRRDRPARRPARPRGRARPGAAAHRQARAQPRPLPDADAVDRRAGRGLHRGGRRDVAADRRRRGLQRRRPARRRRLAAAPHARPDRPAPGAARPARGRLRDAGRAGGRVGVAARRGPRGRAQPLGLRAHDRGPGRPRRDRHRPRPRRRGGRRLAHPRRLAGRRGRRRRERRGPRPAALARGLGLRLDAAAGGGRPGPLPRAVRARLADHRAAGAARAAGRRARDAARAGGAAGAARRPGDRRAAGQDPPRVPARGPRVAHRARVAGARRRAALLRLLGLDAVVPRAARGARRRRADGGARAGSGARRATWLERALVAGGGLVRYGPREHSGGLTQQGWRDVRGPAADDDDGGGIVRPDGSTPRAPLADTDVQAVAYAALRALGGAVRRRGLEPPRRGARGAGSRATSAPA